MSTDPDIAATENPLSHPKVIKKTVTVDYSRSKQAALLKTEHGRNVGKDRIAKAEEEIAQAPENGTGTQKVVVHFLPLEIIPEKYCTPNGEIDDHALEVYLKDHDLESVDLHTAAAVSEQNPYFSDRCQYAIHFRDGAGGWLSAIFFRWLDGRGLAAGRRKQNKNWQKRDWHFAVSGT